MQIKTFIFNPFQVNTYVVYDETKECAIIDAGCSTPSEFGIIQKFIQEEGLKIKYLLNTHCHVDHLMGIALLEQQYNFEFLAHKEDMPLLERTRDMATAFALDVEEPSKPNRYIEEGETILVGNIKFEILHVPGHSPGSIVFYNKNDNRLFVGDVLFSGSIGRTDLPGGDYDTLISSIKEKLMTLPVETIVYSGHGETTTIGEEKDTNPFLI